MTNLFRRALAGVVLTALAATATIPAAAAQNQTQSPSQPGSVPNTQPQPAQPSPAPRTTPLAGPSPSYTKPQVIGTPTPAPGGSAIPATGGGPAAVASPITSLPPASQPNSSLPYPAYGTPAPGMNRGVAASDIPQVINLQAAIAIGFARSPLLAQARADVAIATAPVDLAKTALFPNLSGTVSSTRSHRQPGSESTGNTTTTTTGSTGSTGTGGTTGTGTGGTTGTGTGGTTGTGTGGTTGTGTGGTTGTGSTTGTSTGTTTGTPNATDFTSNAATITLRQLIYDGGKVLAQLRSAQANQSASIQTYRRELQTVAYNVANAYYAALAAQRQTAVALETVKINQVNENLVNAQIRAGVAARADLATSQLPTAQARVAVVRAQSTELTAQATFVNAMGLDANILALPQDDGNILSNAAGTSAVVVPAYNQAVTRALLLRPDYAAQLAQVESYKQSVRAAKLGLSPTLNGTASATTASTDTGGGTFRNNSSIGLVLAIPIFDQGITRAQVAQAQGQLDLQNATLTLTTQSIQLNVKQSLIALISAHATFDQVQAELTQARSVLQSTQAQYRAGVTTLPLLLNAQVGLTQALTDQVTAVYTLRQAEAAFLYAEGANAPA